MALLNRSEKRWVALQTLCFTGANSRWHVVGSFASPGRTGWVNSRRSWKLSEIHDLEGLSVVFLAQNEQRNIEASVASVCDWGVPVYLVDGGSADRTREVCAARGVVVLERPFDHWALQRNWALKHPAIEGRWILFLDADEEVTEEFRASVRTALCDGSQAGWYVNRRFWFLGRPIVHGGLSPNWVLRLVRRDTARWEADGMRECAVVEGSVAHLDGVIEHRDRRGLLFWSAKHVWLAGLEADFTSMRDEPVGQHRESSFRRMIRRTIFPKLPPTAMAMSLFLYRYVVRLGFLDGYAGFIYCLMREFWFPLLVATVQQERDAGVVVDHAQVERLRDAAFGPGW